MGRVRCATKAIDDKIEFQRADGLIERKGMAGRVPRWVEQTKGWQ